MALLVGTYPLVPAFMIVGSATGFAFCMVGIAIFGTPIACMKLCTQFDLQAFLALLVGIATKAGVMLCGMGALAWYQLQVLKTIVEFIAVSVVNNLSREQCTSKVLPHDITMLKDTLPMHRDYAVATAQRAPTVIRMGRPCTSRKITTSRTILLSLSCRYKVHTAVLTQRSRHVYAF